MKKALFSIICLFIIIITVGCKQIIPKTEYEINETAIIDNIKIKLIDKKIENKTLELVFEITNQNDKSITLDPDNNFKLYDNQIVLSNIYTGNKNVLKQNKTTNYTLQYNIEEEQEIYNIYFYSGVVENNIKFIIDNANE